MIHYQLRCTPASHAFDGWFRSSDDFDRQCDAGLVACPACGTTSVEKALMRPAVSGIGTQVERSEPAGDAVASGPVPAEFVKAVRRLQKISRTLRAKADYVGTTFAEEARRIHFGEVEERQIYGEATRDEVERLVEDGIPALPLPPLPEDAH